MPLVSYDNIKAKDWDIVQQYELHDRNIYGKYSFEFFWFFIEELMKTGTPLIADYFFSVNQIGKLDEMIGRYKYEAVTYLLDCETETAYRRFIERNNGGDRPEGLRVSCTFEDFNSLSGQNRAFRFGRRCITIKTDDFSKLDLEKLCREVADLVFDKDKTD